MYKHVAETVVAVPKAKRVAEKICARSSAYCRSVVDHNNSTLLDFGDARAILRATVDALHFRVEAQDIVIFSGIRTLFQGSLADLTTITDPAVEWQPACSLSLRTIPERNKKQGGRTIARPT